MDVQVGHFLVAVLADIRQDAVAVAGHSGVAGDLADGAYEGGDLGVRRLPRNRRTTRTAPWDDQDMGRTQGLMSWKAKVCSSS